MPDVFKFDPEAKTVTFHGDAGLELLDSYYRPPGKAREQQPFLATVWRRPLCDQGAGVD